MKRLNCPIPSLRTYAGELAADNAPKAKAPTERPAPSRATGAKPSGIAAIPAAADSPPGPGPLHLAAGEEDLRDLRAMLADSYDPNALDEQGRAPLHIAAAKSRAAAVADPDMQDEDAAGSQPLDLAPEGSETAALLEASGGRSTAAPAMAAAAREKPERCPGKASGDSFEP